MGSHESNRQPRTEQPRSSASPPGASTKPPPRPSGTEPPRGAGSSGPRPSAGPSTKPPPRDSQTKPPPRNSYRWSTSDAPSTNQIRERELRWPALIGVVVLIVAAIVKNGGVFDSEAVERTPNAIAHRGATETPKPKPTATRTPRPTMTPYPTATPYPVNPNAVAELVITGNGQSTSAPYRGIELVPGTHAVKVTIYSTEIVFFSAALRPTTRQYAPVLQLVSRNFPPNPVSEMVTIRSGEPYSFQIRCSPGIPWRLELSKIN